MSLSHDEVQRLLQLLDASQFDELQLEADGTKLTLRRNGAGTTPTGAPSRNESGTALPAPPVGAAPVAALPAIARASGLVEVRAPMLGTFYGTPKPGAAPFVSVGEKVEPDTAIGIIEVMKLMNSVPAGVAGEVVEVLVRDGELVEFEQPLMRLRPA
jgi:acetyl-CoA carboxylase biotin carboxyl carrier protein